MTTLTDSTTLDLSAQVDPAALGRSVPGPRSGQPLSHVRGLDGLRGVAVALVVAYHLPLTVAVLPGGTLGVDVFFVLSGFLITSVLIEHASALSTWSAREIRTQLKTFWLRRVARLAPALLTLVLAWTVIWGVTRGGSFFNISVGRQVDAPHVAAWVNIRGLFGVVFYAYNWLAASGTPLPLAFTHLWSLSVEEQFYLFWPLLLLLMLRTGRLRMLIAVSALLVVASVVLAGLHSAANGYAWSYFGTDSRAQELLLGALLAMGWSAGRLHMARRIATVCAVAGVGVLGFCSRFLDAHGWWAAHGGMTVVGLAAAAIVLAVLNDGGGPAAWLESAPLRWLGRRSYAVYLWSYPITMWSARISPWFQAVLVVALSFTIAEFSWRFVEQPVQQRVRAALAAQSSRS
jgi:peptidoglycan/LPS O-acetylase OafA/YrhL